MIKKSDENSIHTTETAYDKAIRRMEEREAHILDSRADYYDAAEPPVRSS